MTPLTSIDGLLRLLDTRSFAALWFWVTLALAWAVVNRGVLGVPGAVIAEARRDPAAHGPALLDWLALTVPRRLMAPGEAALAMAAGAFGLTSLGVLGFAYGLEMAQALTLLLGPLALLGLTRAVLARQVAQMLAAGAADRPALARRLASRLTRHRLIGTGLSILAAMGAAGWGALWNLTHPNGL